MDYISGWCNSKRKLQGVTAIVTGSNTGIGKETARDFYIRGARVIMACRDLVKAKSAKKEIEDNASGLDTKGALVIEKLDLTSLKSVREFAKRMLESESAINILINNAGVFCVPENRTEDGFEVHMGTNHFGHALLTMLLLPRIIKSAPSRIVNVSSKLHQVGEVDMDDINIEKTTYHPLKGYARSKCANVLFTRALAQKLKEQEINDVTVYSVHPGVINTEIWTHFNTNVWFGPVWVFQNILYWFAKTPQCGAQTTIYCAVDEACGRESGLYYSDCAVTPSSYFTQSDQNASKFWDLTMKLLKLDDYNAFSLKDPFINVED